MKKYFKIKSIVPFYLKHKNKKYLILIAVSALSVFISALSYCIHFAYIDSTVYQTELANKNDYAQTTYEKEKNTLVKKKKSLFQKSQTSKKTVDKTVDKTEGKSIKEMSELLKELGIKANNNEAAIMVELIFSEYASHNQFVELLYWMGQGTYYAKTNGDIELWDFTPNSKDVYSMDFEYKGAANIYTLCLKGINSISDEDFTITKINEDISKLRKKNASGSRTVSFRLNGKKYVYKTANTDNIKNGFETDMLNFVNAALIEQGFEKKLYFLNYNNVGCMIFYGTDEWAEQFKEKTGMRLVSEF